ncbi:hypothetical protein F4779DRAFT_619524 [Xylariaceae sp. FL0662B]|nr:hypothetical protein F4779DRAFT_619524 [Xylariaceae sp. FL0662B]
MDIVRFKVNYWYYQDASKGEKRQEFFRVWPAVLGIIYAYLSIAKIKHTITVHQHMPILKQTDNPEKFLITIGLEFDMGWRWRSDLKKQIQSILAGWSNFSTPGRQTLADNTDIHFAFLDFHVTHIN